MKIALLGAESTGKSELGQSLTAYFQLQGNTVQHIPEYLRLWCEQKERTPTIDEQLGIATEQARQITDAARSDYLIADTTPLMIAIYSDLLFDDKSLYEMALACHKTFDMTILMGLDIPWVADGIQRDGPHVREPVDAKIRAALTRGGINYHMVYGSGEARLLHALRCLGVDTFPGAADLERQNQPKLQSQSQSQPQPQRLRNWTCERCSDPECEHRLFHDLLNKP